MAAGRGRDEVRSLRLTVQGALVVVVAAVIVVALIALTHTLNADSARNDCVASSVTVCTN